MKVLPAHNALGFCSQRARNSGELLTATASHALGCVLFTYPKRFWARNALRSEGLPEALVRQLSRLANEHEVVTRLLAHEGLWEETTDVYLFPQNYRLRSVPIAELAGVLEAVYEGNAPANYEELQTPLLAVCTHGQRDRCCARYGLDLVHALRRAKQARGSLTEVFEASHLGGDRFAPTALALPSGRMYGHLESAEAGRLLESEEGGALLLERFRGSLWLDPLQQLAEVAAYSLPGLEGALPILGPIGLQEVDEQRCNLQVKCSWKKQNFLLVAECFFEEHVVYSDCKSIDEDTPASVGKWYLQAVHSLPLADSENGQKVLLK